MRPVLQYVLDHRVAYLGALAFLALAAYEAYLGDTHSAVLYAAAAATAAGFKGSLEQVKGLLPAPVQADVDAGEKKASPPQ
jgi:hypothetical protein